MDMRRASLVGIALLATLLVGWALAQRSVSPAGSSDAGKLAPVYLRTLRSAGRVRPHGPLWFGYQTRSLNRLGTREQHGGTHLQLEADSHDHWLGASSGLLVR